MSSQNEIDAAIALSRFGLGATGSGIAPIVKDPRAALKEEITERLLPMPVGPDLKPTPELMQELYAFNDRRKAERDAKAKEAVPAAPTAGPQMAQNQMGSTPQGMAKPDNAMAPAAPATAVATPKKEEPYRPYQIFLAEADARFNGTIHEPKIGFPERLTWFWANHFAISVDKGEPDRVLAGAYEREAIRTNLFGKFYDMLVAVETHPAMIEFLDNQQSIGPNSKAGLKNKRGLNENLARETMELHTLGVNGGYTQADVTSLARIITGWSIAGRQAKLGEAGTFVFNANAHEPGDQVLLGKTFPDTGLNQGKDALLMLARHPSTARFIAFKLARHFVADNPPPPLVNRLAETFIKTDGDLSAVYLALISSPESWQPKQTKVRTPLEFMFAMLRASAEQQPIQRIVSALNALGQPLWAPSGPNGFGDVAPAWASSEGLATRIDIAAIAASAMPLPTDPRAFLDKAFGPILSEPTRQAVARAETRNQGLAIAFLSPEFQRR